MENEGDRISNITALDKGTIIEFQFSFKVLKNPFQLEAFPKSLEELN